MDDEKVALISVKLGHLAVEREADPYVRELAELCTQAVDAERSSVFLVDRDRGEIFARMAQRVKDVEIRLPLGKGLAGHSAATGETINVPDAYAHPRFDRSWDQRTGFRTRNLMVVPVWGRDGRTVVGVIQVLNKRNATFERRDQMLLERIAAQVGPMLERIQLAEVR